ncbi:zinc-finger associated domain (zf-AD) domain-containing protein [Phthorimaea operculella]|nr:zinc-finger associated domain (zf-AD) domain-containing protein [Phthorimaea operculella]
MAASTSDGLHEFIRFGPNTSPREDCRICLKNLGMVPIFGDQHYPDISLEIVAFCGIQVTQDEEFPRYICPTCFSTIENAIALRTTAQRTDALLRRRKKRQTQVIELKPDATLIDVKLEMPEESVVESSSATIPTEPSMIKLEAISYDQALSQTYGLNIPQMPMYCIDKPIQQQQQELSYSSYSVTDSYASVETPPEPANTSRECSICNKIVHCKSYSRHVKNHDPSEREKRKAKAHELKQNGVRIPTVKKKKECNICKLIIDSKSMSRHMKRKHGGANNIEEPTTGSPGVPSITSLETG